MARFRGTDRIASPLAPKATTTIAKRGPRGGGRAARPGRRAVTFDLDTPSHARLDRLRFERQSTFQALMIEAANLLMERYGQIGDLTNDYADEIAPANQD